MVLASSSSSSSSRLVAAALVRLLLLSLLLMAMSLTGALLLLRWLPRRPKACWVMGLMEGAEVVTVEEEEEEVEEVLAVASACLMSTSMEEKYTSRRECMPSRSLVSASTARAVMPTWSESE